MDWQLIIVGVVVLGAVAFLVRRLVATWSKPRCSDGCASCSQGPSKTNASELVQLRVPSKNKPTQ